MSLRHCTLSCIDRFIRTSTKVWDSPGPISINHCHPQQKNWETTRDSFQYLWSLSFCPLCPDFWEGRLLLWTELHGTGLQGLVKRSSWCTLMTETKTWKAVWMFWSFHYVIPSRHIYNSLKWEQRWGDVCWKWCLLWNIHIVVGKSERSTFISLITNYL